MGILSSQVLCTFVFILSEKSSKCISEFPRGFVLTSSHYLFCLTNSPNPKYFQFTEKKNLQILRID